MPRTKKNKTNLNLEKTLFSKGAKLVAGMDEVGRGCLAGPVYVGITVLNKELALDELLPEGLTDSKELTKDQRETLLPQVKSWVLEHSIGQASNSEIDEIGLTRALRRAGRRALNSLVNKPDYLILDGKHNWLMPEKETLDIFNEEVDDGPISANMKIINLIKADLICSSVAAASIVAKVARDQVMNELNEEFPDYLWNENKGYAAPEHLLAIKKYGPSKYHRISWKTFQN